MDRLCLVNRVSGGVEAPVDVYRTDRGVEESGHLAPETLERWSPCISVISRLILGGDRTTQRANLGYERVGWL
jgi:hypothetical protein